MRVKTENIRTGQTGFTLVELLVVLAILGMIAAFAAPQIFKYLGSAKQDSAKIQIENLSTGLDLYKLETGHYPASLSALVEKPPGEAKWNGPYLKKRVIPKDPWDRDYIYQYPFGNGLYELKSYGADGQDGGEGENSDITSAL